MNKVTTFIDDVLLDSEDEYLRSSGYWFQDVGGYVTQKSNNQTMKMHRIIMKAEKGQMIDHINGNRLDNRKENLRFCTKSQNAANAKKRRNCSSQYKGVGWYKAYQIWRAYIRVDQVDIFLGYFYREQDAALAYNRAALKYFKEFAKLNEVEDA